MSTHDGSAEKSVRYLLLSWTARNNDPYERKKDDTFIVQKETGERISGPSLTLLFHEQSPYRGKVHEAIMFYRLPIAPSEDDPEREKKLAEETRLELLRVGKSLGHPLKVELRSWEAADPTDHKGIFVFIEDQLRHIRKKYPEHTLLLHVSPGTPSMQTIWVVMAETGYVSAPFEVVKSYRDNEARGRPRVAKVELGIPSLYKRLQEDKPAQISARDENLFWDPALFQSQKLKTLYDEARRLARLRVPVLLLGERGTGKTRFASWIRLNSQYRKRDLDTCWPSVPCGQYTPELMRAELFGYKKGAFTGATEHYAGLLARAHEDTLFLDEVGDISRDLQRLLIRAIEDRSYSPIGTNKVEQSNFRLITATNLSPERLREKLDPDFYDRISYFVLTLPPLREIREELPWLWEKVFRASLADVSGAVRAERLGQNQHQRIVRTLQDHPLPGNLRDLFRVAWHLLAGLEAPPELRLSPEDAVTRALQQALAPVQGGEHAIAQDVCRAFARQETLDNLLPPDTPLDLDVVERELKGYLSQELRRVARQRKVEIKTVCNKDERTLQKWDKAVRDARESNVISSPETSDSVG